MNITELIHCKVDQYISDGLAISVESINDGKCEEFAEEVCSLVPGAEAWWEDELGDTGEYVGHKVIRYKGMYYDSQNPEGHRDWRFLMRYHTYRPFGTHWV